MVKTVVEVLSVARATDGLTGEDVTAVQFGIVSRAVKSNSPQVMGPFGATGAPASLVLTLLFKFKTGVAPYKVGSKWTIDVSETGSFVLEEAKQ
jgi:hypothetical protein